VELRGALESTDWHAFINSSTELDDIQLQLKGLNFNIRVK